MVILSHRGYWHTPVEKNSLVALKRSLDFGYGTELDVRDYDGTLVISHDPPVGKPLEASEVFELFYKTNPTLAIAINIKSDGLQKYLCELVADYPLENYFLFDMSIPDAIASTKSGLPIFTRQSDKEAVPCLYAESKGVWIDAFETYDWITEEIIQGHLASGKKICVVSPELHGRPHQALWQRVRSMGCLQSKNFMICSDMPELANRYFNT